MNDPLIVIVQKNSPCESVAQAAARAAVQARRLRRSPDTAPEVVVLTGARRHLQDAALLSHHEGNGFGVANVGGSRVVVLPPAAGLAERRPVRRLGVLDDEVQAQTIAARVREAYAAGPEPVLFSGRPAA